MKNWKYVIIIICGIILNYLFVQWNKTQVQERKRVENEKIQINKDSLFSLVDKAVEDSKKEKSEKEKEIVELKVKVQQQQKQVATSKKQLVELAANQNKNQNQNSNTNESEHIVMASGYDVSGMERELQRKQEMITRLMKINSQLNNEIDSLRTLIEKK